MATPLLILILILTLLFTALPPGRSSAASPNSTNFIRRSCSVTLYPQRCYSSLKPYATTVRQNPLTLAVIAANISLAMIKESSFQAAALRRSNTNRIASALHDCVDLLRTAADLTRQSTAEIQKLGPAAQAGGPSFAWEVSNAQTWMSSALTNEDTCIDGFEEVDGGGGGDTAAVAMFRAKVGRVEQYTSNALALLNALVSG